ncbi:uncharacterized protein [Taeniopygia guttata]|uniref:uncharacterized protein n=1 Tax=Taeniopygia guttata TaxID=59729 RepID=UPI003BB84FD4
MTSCLVAIPSKLEEYPTSLHTLQTQINTKNPPNKWVEIFSIRNSEANHFHRHHQFYGFKNRSRHRFHCGKPMESVDSPPLETSQAHLDVFLCHLLQVTLPWQGAAQVISTLRFCDSASHTHQPLPHLLRSPASRGGPAPDPGTSPQRQPDTLRARPSLRGCALPPAPNDPSVLRTAPPGSLRPRPSPRTRRRPVRPPFHPRPSAGAKPAPTPHQGWRHGRSLPHPHAAPAERQPPCPPLDGAVSRPDGAGRASEMLNQRQKDGCSQGKRGFAPGPAVPSPASPGSRPARAVPAAPALPRSSRRVRPAPGPERSAPLRPRAAGAAAAVALWPLWRHSAIGTMAELPLPAGLCASTFPAKLWRLVNSPRVRSVRWDSRALGLLIDRSLFERELLSPGNAQGPAPRPFRATRFRSFVRQLHRYGFRRVPGRAGSAAPGDAGAWLHYSNPCFRRDRPDLLLCVRRRSTPNRQRPAAGREGRRRPPPGSQQLPGARPLPDGQGRRARFRPLPTERPLPPGARPAASTCCTGTGPCRPGGRGRAASRSSMGSGHRPPSRRCFRSRPPTCSVSAGSRCCRSRGRSPAAASRTSTESSCLRSTGSCSGCSPAASSLSTGSSSPQPLSRKLPRALQPPVLHLAVLQHQQPPAQHRRPLGKSNCHQWISALP